MNLMVLDKSWMNQNFHQTISCVNILNLKKKKFDVEVQLAVDVA